jgi:hypothetical protein
VEKRVVTAIANPPNEIRYHARERYHYQPRLESILLFFIALGVIAVLPAPSYRGEEAPGALGAGAKLYLRLDAPVSTKTSHLNQAVTAQVVRQVVCDHGILIPLGAQVSGTIDKLIPSSRPVDHARMRIRFTQLSVPGHPPVALAAHLTEVENAREAVLPDGTIQGVLEKDAPIGRIDYVLDRLGATGTQMEKVGGKTFGKPDTTIDYAAGTDLVLTLDRPLSMNIISLAAATPRISPTLADEVKKLLANAPHRAEGKSKKPGDPLNLVIAGSSEQIFQAFRLAGWTEATKLGRTSAIGTARAVWDGQGYVTAPVSQLFLYGHAEDIAFEKMLNTFMRRHHLRLWRTEATTSDGREIWLGACTHDIGLDVHPGVVSHAIDPVLDLERAKVGADLVAAGLVAGEQLVSPPDPLSEGRTATGGTWKTDGQLLVIELKASGT